MSQQSVLNYLQEHKGEWFTARHIAEQIEVSQSTTINNLRKLRENDDVYYNNKNTPKLYKYRK